jgi:hypothetical protein
MPSCVEIKDSECYKILESLNKLLNYLAGAVDIYPRLMLGIGIARIGNTERERDAVRRSSCTASRCT